MHTESAIALLIFVIVPFLGILAYVWLCIKMAFANVEEIPYGSFFVILGGWGEVLEISLTVTPSGYSAQGNRMKLLA